MQKMAVGVVLLVLGVLAAVVIPQYSATSSGKLNQLSKARRHLISLIEAEDRYYQRKGMYVAVSGSDDIKEQLGWCETGCGECRYSVTVNGKRFTAEVNCQTSDREQQYLGYVRTEPGELVGIDQSSGTCSAEGIYAGSRYLVNDVGPCRERSWSGMAVVSGSKRHLVIETFPANATVFINGAAFGTSEVNHTSLSPEYGSLYIGEVPENPVMVKVSKEGFVSVEFELSWGSYTHTAAVVLSPEA